MKKFLIIILFINQHSFAEAQVDNINTWKNSRPDTVTTYEFSDKSILAKRIPGAKPTLNRSFKKPGLQLRWSPIMTSDINNFVGKSLQGFNKFKILDTLRCDIFKQDYRALVFEGNKTIYLFLFQNKPGKQDFFIGSGLKKNTIQQTLNFISTALQ